MAIHVDRIEDYPGCGKSRVQTKYIQIDAWDSEIITSPFGLSTCGEYGKIPKSRCAAWAVLCDDCLKRYGLEW